LALLWSLGLEWEDWLAPVQNLRSEERQALLIQLERGLNTPQTSSLGRLFDAATSLAGVRQTINYEAQAAIEFEAALDPVESGAYHFDIGRETIGARECIQGLLKDAKDGTPIPIISARFHNGLADMARQVCVEIRRKTGIREVALSGGVWQNMTLLERAIRRLEEDGFVVHLHHLVPANDGGLSLGQALVGAARFGS
jgi:hydrogenase maturation protein HypF